MKILQQQALERGIKFFRETLGSTLAANYRVYGYLHISLGAALTSDKKYSHAKDILNTSETLLGKVKDWSSPQEAQHAFQLNIECRKTVKRGEGVILAVMQHKDDCLIM